MWQLANNERETRREAILFSTRTLMNAVDTILSKQIAVAQMLATSPALENDDLAAFRKEAERAAHGPVRRLDRAEPTRTGSSSSICPAPKEPLPRRSAGRSNCSAALSKPAKFRSPEYSTGRSEAPVVTVEVPVGRKDKPPLVHHHRACSPASSSRCSSNGICRKGGSQA